MNCCALFILIVTAIVTVFVDEVNPVEEEDTSFFTMLKAFKGFLTN